MTHSSHRLVFIPPPPPLNIIIIFNREYFQSCPHSKAPPEQYHHIYRWILPNLSSKAPRKGLTIVSIPPANLTLLTPLGPRYSGQDNGKCGLTNHPRKYEGMRAPYKSSIIVIHSARVVRFAALFHLWYIPHPSRLSIANKLL